MSWVSGGYSGTLERGVRWVSVREGASECHGLVGV